MELLLLFFIYFVFFLLFYKISFFIKTKEKKKKKDFLASSKEMMYLTNKYKLNIKKIGVDKIINLICFANAIIFTLVLIATFLIDNLFIRIIIMFLLLIPLIFIVYHIIGSFYRKKGMIIDV